jgi:hypothetical protein
MFKDIKVEEIVVYLMLIVVGYYIAKMFSRSCNGFSVGGQPGQPRMPCSSWQLGDYKIACDQYGGFDTSKGNQSVTKINLRKCCNN